MTDKSYSLLDRAGLNPETARKAVADALSGADDGELYLEYVQTEGLAFDNGRLKTASYDESRVSACAPLPARRPATPIPARSPRPRSSAPAKRSPR